jgi:hypothetical protein
VGSWRVTAVDNLSSKGARGHFFGEQSFGMATFDDRGHYSLLIISQARPTFSAWDKSKGTPEEYN